MNDAGPVTGILLTHGSMAEGLLDAVRRIAAPDPGALLALSNEGCSPETLVRRLDEAAGTGAAIIFTDLQAGSCALAARMTCGSPGRRGVISGVNLPMLLDFVFHRELELEELIPRLVERGRAAVQGIPPVSYRVDHPVSG